MPELIQELTDCRGVDVRVDRVAHVLHGVKLLGLVSKNGRRYLPEALAEAAPLYERAKVNVNHAVGGPLAPRSYHDRLGVVRDVRLREGEGLFGNLHFNPKHAVAEQLLWDAENAPENVGLSHNVLARTVRRGSETVVEEITRVKSVDLVADPATTGGLFEEESAKPQAVARERVYELLAEHELPLPGAKNRHARAITSEDFLESLWNAPDEATIRRLIEARADVMQASRRWRGLSETTARPVARDQTEAAAYGAPSARRTVEEFVAAITG